jgi:hypothetical protein
MPMALHHQRVWDVVNGREPRDMHPAIRYQMGRKQRLLLNFPPFHGKTQWSVAVRALAHDQGPERPDRDRQQDPAVRQEDRHQVKQS